MTWIVDNTGRRWVDENPRVKRKRGRGRFAEIKVEKAAEAARRAKLVECASCKALFEPAIIERTHINPVRELTSAEQTEPIYMCAECHRFHTDTWFNHGSRSTRKSE